MSIAVVPIPEPQPASGAAAPFTLAVDIGGSSIKASVLDGAGKLVAPQLRTPTPKAATPQAKGYDPTMGARPLRRAIHPLQSQRPRR